MSRELVRFPSFACVIALSALACLPACSDGGDGSTPPDSPAPPASPQAERDAAADTTTATAGTWFEEATDAWGVDFVHDSGASGDLQFPEMMGGGIAIFDADGDDDLDLYFVNGALLDGGSGAGPINRYYEQRDGRFVEATAGSGLGDPGYGTGVAVGDFDNDGAQDVYVANVGQDKLFRGQGDGTFVDATSAAGVDVGDWSTSAAFCDLNRDGHLDLYVVRYVIWDPDLECTDKAGRKEYCGPDSFTDETDVLLMNNGDGTFRDASEASGISEFTGAGLGVVCEDFDDDGWADVYVANDGDPNLLWMNQRDGTFVDDALIMGTSVNAQGLSEAGMGVVAADFDNDTDFDLFVTHLRDETNTFYRNLGQGIGFADETTQVGLASESTPYTGFGTAPFDADLDGDLDLVIANGRVTRGDPLTNTLGAPWDAYAEPNLAYANDAGQGFRLVADSGIEGHLHVSRALATGDLDGDGDLDVVLGNVHGPVRVYRNLAHDGGTDGPPHWLMVDAIDPRFGPDGRRALGARVTVTVGDSGGGTTQVRTIQSAMSYLSSSDPRAHFGLGDAAGPATVTVRWPDGMTETFPGVEIDRVVVLRRGEGS